MDACSLVILCIAWLVLGAMVQLERRLARHCQLQHLWACAKSPLRDVIGTSVAYGNAWWGLVVAVDVGVEERKIFTQVPFLE